MTYIINPTDVSGLLHWFRSDYGVTLSGSNVTSWKSVISELTGSQNSSSHQPILVDNSVNGYPKISFSSGSTQTEQSGLDCLSFEINQPQPWSVVLVWQMFEPAIGVFDGSGDDGHARIFSTYDLSTPSQYSKIEFIAVGPGDHVIGTTLGEGTNKISCEQNLNLGISYDNFGTTVIVGNGLSSSVVNNENVVISGNAGSGSLTQLNLGARAVDYRGGGRIDVLEMMIYSGSVSMQNIADITTYVTSRYNI